MQLSRLLYLIFNVKIGYWTLNIILCAPYTCFIVKFQFKVKLATDLIVNRSISSVKQLLIAHSQRKVPEFKLTVHSLFKIRQSSTLLNNSFEPPTATVRFTHESTCKNASGTLGNILGKNTNVADFVKPQNSIQLNLQSQRSHELRTHNQWQHSGSN